MHYPDYRNVPDRCHNCPYRSEIRVGDSFDRASKIICKKTDRVVDSYAEKGRVDFPPPEWCPLIKWRVVEC